MEQGLKYTVIHSKKQYDTYCKKLEELVFLKIKNKAIKEEVELLTLLIEKYDEENNISYKLDPIDLLKSLMKEHHIKPVDLSKILNVSEGLVSDMLHRKKGMSKETIRILSKKFKLRQEAFNKPYKLVTVEIKKPRSSSSKINKLK
jgi:HTH-type transcriptional regulator/antitoxin HigA